MAIQIEIKKQMGGFCLQAGFQSESRRVGILGASGSGKSMLLKSIAGIIVPDSGLISIDGRVLYDSAKGVSLKTQKRRVGYVFQNYALFPTMTVRDNIGAGIKGTKAEKEGRIKGLLERFGLEELERQFPHELSGGQQQRVALARTMVCEPDMILLDEPFSALDDFLKEGLQRQMQEMLEDYPGTVVLVSHNRDEIYRFSEELLILQKGKSVCMGETKEIFENPCWREAARLTGCKNIVAVKRQKDGTLFVPAWDTWLFLEGKISEDIKYVGIRAHDFIPVWGNREKNCIPVKIRSMAQLPFERKYFLEGIGKEAEEICWFVQRELCHLLDERGLPDWLKLPEEKILLLK